MLTTWEVGIMRPHRRTNLQMDSNRPWPTSYRSRADTYWIQLEDWILSLAGRTDTDFPRYDRTDYRQPKPYDQHHKLPQWIGHQHAPVTVHRLFYNIRGVVATKSRSAAAITVAAAMIAKSPCAWDQQSLMVLKLSRSPDAKTMRRSFFCTVSRSAP